MKVSVPLMLESMINGNKSELLRRLSELNASEVLICFADNGCYNPFKEMDVSLVYLKEADSFLRAKGYQTAVWIPTLDALQKQTYTSLTGFDGNAVATWKCPMDEEFVDDYICMVKQIAQTGIRKIVLEDDFRMQLPGAKAACFCEKHMQFYSDYLGKAVTREEMAENAFDKGLNEYREAWIAGNRTALKNFAKKIREAIDETDDTIAIRLCCGPTLFGGDGSDPFELKKILQGKTEDIEYRLIGAPYWGKMFDMNIASPLDFTRHQAFECKKHGITTILEGDPYPRPRYAVPASELEFFHTVALADGNFDGIMKYGLDYVSDFDYETGYAKQNKKNESLYKEIEELFSDKKCVGVHLVEPFDWVKYAREIPESPEMRVIRSASRRFLNDLSIPAVFEPNGVNVIFGENARHIDRSWLKNGSVLDIKAALILQEQGIDVGIEKIERHIPGENGHGLNSYREEYCHMEKSALYSKLLCCYSLTLNLSAAEKSRLYIVDCECTGSYTYENENGERFLVYNFDMEEAVQITGLVRSYYRQRQFVELHEWLNGKKLDAVCVGNPDLYMLTKKSENALAIGLWNHFADETMQPVINLAEAYKQARFINCEGVLDKDTVTLTSPIGAYSFGFIELLK